MATWTDTATIKAGVDSGDPGIGIGGFGEQVPNNLQYLKDGLDRIGIASDHNLYDDFVAFIAYDTAAPGLIDTSLYAWEYGAVGGGATSVGLIAAPDHAVALIHVTGAANYAAMRSGPGKINFDLSRTFSVTMEWRYKKVSASEVAETWTMGFQDSTLGINAAADVTDQTDFIGFRQGAIDTFDAITASGGATTVVGNDVGTATNWTTLKIVITGSTSVEFFVDGTSVGATAATITAVALRPFFGFSGGTVTHTHHIDYALAYFHVRPLSA